MKFLIILILMIGCGGSEGERNIATDDKYLTVSSLGSIDSSNVSNYLVSGTCSEEAGTISLDVDGSSLAPIANCTNGNWSIAYDFQSILDGMLDLRFIHFDSSGVVADEEAIMVEKDTVIPVINFDSLAAIDSMNDSNYQISGTCSEEGQSVEISITGVTITTQPNCVAGVWNKFVDVSGLADGTIQILADHESTEGESALQISVDVVKDANLPLVAITVAADIDQASEFSYTISGTCSEESETVEVDVGGETQSPLCQSGTWEATVNPSSIPDGSVVITANHSNAAGTPANQGSVTVNKDVAPPSVTIDSAPDINAGNQSAYTFSGSCSENNVEVTVVIGDMNPSTQPTCNSGSWSVTMDVSSIPDGPVDISADHDVAGQAAVTIEKATTLLL